MKTALLGIALAAGLSDCGISNLEVIAAATGHPDGKIPVPGKPPNCYYIESGWNGLLFREWYTVQCDEVIVRPAPARR